MCCRGPANSVAQAFSSLGHGLSGPAAFLGRSLPSSVRTWSVVKEMGGKGGSEEGKEDGADRDAGAVR